MRTTNQPRPILFLCALGLLILLNASRLVLLYQYGSTLKQYAPPALLWAMLGGAALWCGLFTLSVVLIWLGWGVSRWLALILLTLYLVYNLSLGMPRFPFIYLPILLIYHALLLFWLHRKR